MSALSIRTAPPTDAGRLYPRYDGESRILTLASRLKRPWPYAVNIDAMLICDLDEKKVLANVDLHYARDRWPRRERVEWRGAAAAADIVFEFGGPSTWSLALPVSVVSDGPAGVVKIFIGDAVPDSAFALSDDCVAETKEGRLTGFTVRLHE